MDLTKEIEKEVMRELAWKELIDAIKPGEIMFRKKPAHKAKAGGNKKAVYHPAVITSTEFGNWELFG